jgi:hypothetical protein
MQHKRQINFLLAGLTALVLFGWACRPEKLKDYTSVDNGSVSNIVGTWNGVSVNQRDIGAENKNFPYKSQDITAPLQFNSVKLTLNGTSSGTFTFNYGAAPAFFKFGSGNWSVDNASKVGKLYLVNGVDSLVMDMGSYNYLLQNKMQLKQTKTLLGKPAIVYEFMFSK